jgi:hypothetical protein
MWNLRTNFFAHVPRKAKVAVNIKVKRYQGMEFTAIMRHMHIS